MSKIFSVPVLNGFYHNDETVRILRPYNKQRRQSEFIREAILSFSMERGFDDILSSKEKPDYMNNIAWLKMIEAQKRTQYIKYGYVIAFFWLLSLVEFENYKKSVLMREIITWYHSRQ